MTADQHCVCGHPWSLHKPHPDIGNRNECWAVSTTLGQRWCECRQYRAATPEEPDRAPTD